MSTHVEGTFELTGFDEQPHEERPDGSKLTRATIEQELSGPFEGKATAENLMAYDVEGSAVIVGLVRMTGALDGHDGSFLMESRGTFDGEMMRAEWKLLPGSGTDGLAGISGSGSTAAPHGPEGTWTLDYDLPSS